jgi:hypothetical protein
MSLSAREQQKLDAIGHQLASSDPKLASLLATFTRLNSGEEMPVRERIQASWRLGWRARAARRPGARHWARKAPRAARAPRAVRACWRLGWQQALTLWLLIATALVVVAVMISRGQPRACVPSWAIACTRQASAHRFRSPHPAGSHIHNGSRGAVRAQPGGSHQRLPGVSPVGGSSAASGS